jgi:hypothetical protein
MPNHHIVDGGDPEKGHDVQYGYDQKGPTYEEPFVHGHATIAEAAGTGGHTHRGLKSRHIQFLYVQDPHLARYVTYATPGLSEVLLEPVCSSDQAPFSPWLAQRPCSWPISA